jgi:PAS domain S-box-containing protein
MTWLLLYNLVPLTIHVSLGVWILSRRPGHPTNRLFFLVTLILASWGLSELLLLTAEGPGLAVAAELLTDLPSLWLPLAAVLFLQAHFKEATGRALYRSSWLPRVAGGTAAVLTLLTAATPWVVSGALPGPVGFTIREGPLFGPAFLWTMGLLLGIHVGFLLTGRRTLPRPVQLQMMYIGHAPFLPVLAFMLMDVMVPLLWGHVWIVSSFPASILYSLMLGLGAWRTGLMTISPEGAARQILDEQPDGVVLVDPDCRIKFVNAAFHRLRGHEPGACPGAEVLKDVLRVRTAGYRELCGIPWGELPETLHLEAELRGGDGRWAPVLVTFKKWTDASGSASGAILVFRDETPVRRIEAEMIRIENLRGLASLVSGVAHELNNPLTAVLGFSEMGQKSLPPEKAEKYFRTIHASAEKAQRIVKALLDFAGDESDAPGPVSLNEIALEVIRIRQADLDRRGVAVRAELAPALPALEGRTRAFRQVVLNLFNNAAEAVEEAKRPGVVTVRTFQVGRHAALEIADTGVGIPARILPRIFDPFFTTKPVGKGTGLGLSIAQAFVWRMGGRIEVRSEEGKGSAFTMTIPLADGPASSAGACRPAERTAAGTSAERQRGAPGPAADARESHAGEAAPAEDSATLPEGMESRPQDAPTAVILNSGGKDGQGSLPALLRDPEFLKKAVVFGTERLSTETREFIREEGLQSFTKPFSHDAIDTALKRFVDNLEKPEDPPPGAREPQ